MSPGSMALFGVLCFGILTVWVPGLWALGTYHLAIFALAMLCVFQGIRGRGHFASAGRLPLILLAAAPVVGAIQILTGTSSYFYGTLSQTLEWVSLVCIFGVVCTLDEVGARTFRRAMLWFAFGLAAIAIPQHFTADGKIFWAFEIPTVGGFGPFPNRNHWGAFIELMLPIAIYELLRARHNPLLYAVMIGTMYASVIAGASRAASVLCTAALIAVPLMMLRYRFNRDGVATMLLGLFVLTGVFAWIVGPQLVWARLTASGKYELRREFLLASVTMFREHPWHGFGIGTWATVYPQYALIDPGSFANEAHNEWAQWAVEGGIPLLGIMLSVAGWVLWKVFRAPWAFGLVLVLIHSWVEYPFERQALAGWFAAILGLLAVYGTEQS